MTDAMLWMKTWAWMAAAIVLIQIVLVAWTIRRLQEIGHMRERISRLADGLALLTDTTEAGLSALVREVQQLTRRPGPRAASSRSAVQKRVAAAARTGVDVASIASNELLSESEVRLHMKLADAARRGSATAT